MYGCVWRFGVGQIEVRGVFDCCSTKIKAPEQRKTGRKKTSEHLLHEDWSNRLLCIIKSIWTLCQTSCFIFLIAEALTWILTAYYIKVKWCGTDRFRDISSCQRPNPEPTVPSAFTKLGASHIPGGRWSKDSKSNEVRCLSSQWLFSCCCHPWNNKGLSHICR